MLCFMSLNLCMLMWTCCCEPASQRLFKGCITIPSWLLLRVIHWRLKNDTAVDLLSLIQWIVISLLHSVIHTLNNLGQNLFQKALKYAKMRPGVPVFPKCGHLPAFPSFKYLQIILCSTFFSLLVITSQRSRQNRLRRKFPHPVHPHQPHL